jgi:Condensation domain/TubC N-terminal docking domain
MRDKGVRLWCQDGHLHYRAPNGALTQDEIDILQVSKDHIIALLQSTGHGEATDLLRGTRRAPLTFSQLAYWRSYRLEERPAVRQLATVMRLRGPLDIASLRESVGAVVCQHDALRTRIVVHQNNLLQEISPPRDFDLEVMDDIAVTESARESRLKEEAERMILQPIDLSVGPLLGARVIRFNEDESGFIVVMEHMISDAFSLHVFMRDVLTAYKQVLTGEALSLPSIPIQFPDYAIWQKMALRSWIEAHGLYWRERLTGGKRLRLTAGHWTSPTTSSGFGIVSIQIGRTLRTELSNWCREWRTTLSMAIFTAYVALVLRWSNASEAIIPYQTDGRTSPRLQNAIGYFATILYLRVTLGDGGTFVDLLKRLTQEYCAAFEHYDFGYINAQIPSPEFSKNGRFNWISRKADNDESTPENGPGNSLSCSQVSIEDPVLEALDLDDCEPGIVLFDNEFEVAGYIYFPRSRFSSVAMQEFARNLSLYIRSLLLRPSGRIEDLAVPSSKD